MEQEVEKKYRVPNFDAMYVAIERLGARPTIEIFSTHYYAHLDTDDTLKMVDYKDKVEIHRLSTKDGLHSLNEVVPLADVAAGMAWFTARGYHVLDVLDMHDREYSYQSGGFALYTIDDTVHSVILCYTPSKLAEMEAVFGLQVAEQISLPYNKYIAQQGALRTIELA